LGTFVISLDFELHWGVRDHRTVAEYRENLLGVRRVVPALLALFSEYGIHATWATVGFLFFESRDELLAALPNERPHYVERKLDPYAALDEVGKNEKEDPYHFAPTLIRMIQATPDQEIATHTFSHYYVADPGPSLESFRADIRAAKSAGRSFGTEIKSIVFPRNQVASAHVNICAEEGLIAYRGVESDPYVAAGSSTLDRARRFADSYANLSGAGCGLPKKTDGSRIVSVPQSRFMRPYELRLRLLEGLRLRRILSSMTFAAQNQQLFHLWWHPHNFGTNTDRNLSFLRAVLEHYKQLERRFEFQSSTMGEVADSVLVNSVAACRAS
jgi:peptidoglycan/xylan/chitin deacetylase (PgdA/CDA1 family)